MADVRVERLPLDLGPPSGAFTRQLREGKGPALSFLPPIPREPESWQRAIEQAARPALPAALAAALGERQRVLGAGARAVENARALAEAGTVAVVTGQQPGLLGGPLLTLHKAAGAIALARKLDRVDGPRVVPVFWLASDDHDLDEANRAVLLDRQGQARRFSLDIGADGRSLRDIEVRDEHSERLWTQLQEALPDTERAALALAASKRHAGEGFAAWCARALLAQLGDSGLVILEPELLEPYLGEELAFLAQRGVELARALRQAGADLEQAGFAAPLAPPPDQLPVFLREQAHGPRRRVRVLPHGSLEIAGEPTDLSLDALAQSLRSQPTLGSPDAAGRVFVQNALLPVLAYVAGPTEIVYLAQVFRAHQAVGRSFPIALPRPTATWVDARTQAALKAFGLDPRACVRAVQTPEVPADAAIDLPFEQALQAISEHLHGLPAHEVLRAGGRSAQALSTGLDRVMKAWQDTQTQVRKALEADAGVGRARWVRAWNLLCPLDRPQERSLSGLSLAARHGLEVLAVGAAQMDPLEPCHYLLHLGAE